MPYLLGLAVASAALTGRMTPFAALPLALYGVAGYLVAYQSTSWLKAIGHAVFIATTYALFTHAAPGFYNPRLFEPHVYSPGAPPYTFYFNLDKPLLAFWVALCCAWLIQDHARQAWWKAAMLWSSLTIAICSVAAYSLGLIAFSPQILPGLPIILATNLLLVCVAEEMFFRVYMQGGLTRLLNRLWGAAENPPAWTSLVALVVVSILFGLAHHSAGWRYVIVATIAGLGYGLAYRSGGARAAILTHFCLNATQMLLFTYPMLARPG